MEMPLNIDELQSWLQSRFPAQLLSAPPEITLYDDEAVVILPIDAPLDAALAGEERRRAEQQLIFRQREETRPLRMQLARDVQEVVGRPVSWGMRAGESEVLFTTRSAPVMTRLDRFEREVLDTLIAAGIAETRSSALAYLVRAFAMEHGQWLAEVREAIAQVERIRSKLKLAPRSGAPPAREER